MPEFRRDMSRTFYPKELLPTGLAPQERDLRNIHAESRRDQFPRLSVGLAVYRGSGETQLQLPVVYRSDAGVARARLDTHRQQ